LTELTTVVIGDEPVGETVTADEQAGKGVMSEPT